MLITRSTGTLSIGSVFYALQVRLFCNRMICSVVIIYNKGRGMPILFNRSMANKDRMAYPVRLLPAFGIPDERGGSGIASFLVPPFGDRSVPLR